MSDKVLLFLMVNGSQMASEGTLQGKFFKDFWPGFYVGVHIKTGEEFLINLAAVASIISIDRSKVVSGPMKVVIPGEGGIN